MKLKQVGAIAVVVAATWVGGAQASEKTYPCGGHGESHRHHHRHEHDHGEKKPCDCGKIWETINSILVRIETLEGRSTNGTPGPAGPVGPAGPPGPAGKTTVIVLKPVIEWPSQTLKANCRYYNRGAGFRVGSTWHIPVGIACIGTAVSVAG